MNCYLCLVIRKNIDTGFRNEEKLPLDLVFLAEQRTSVKRDKDSRDGFCGVRFLGRKFFSTFACKET